MPWNYGFSAQFYDINPLKYTAGDELAKSVVINANEVTMSTDPNLRTVIPAGTIMRISNTNPKQVAPYTGAGGVIVGVLKRSVDIMTNATKGCEPAAVYWHGAIFATQFIVGFTAYSAALATALPGCKFE